MPLSRLFLPAALLVAAPLLSQASPLLGRVVRVADGDTVTVLDGEHHTWRVRLSAIDAPERGQPWGKVSGAHLAGLLAGHIVEVRWHKRDRYRRLVGVILVDGEDAGLDQVAAGLAWHDTDYASEQPPGDPERYAEAERRAREQRLGLWRDPDPVPPWVWRRRKRKG